MKYPPIAHFINILFLSFVFIFPFVLCLHLPDLSNGSIAGMIAGCWLLGAFLIADWYHWHMTNSLKGCLAAIVIGLLLASASLLIQSWTSSMTVHQLVTWSGTAWSKSRLMLKMYLGGIGIFGCGIASIPRILIIRLFTKDEMPLDTWKE